MSECPSHCCTVRRSTPAHRDHVANVARKLVKPEVLGPASLQAVQKIQLWFASGGRKNEYARPGDDPRVAFSVKMDDTPQRVRGPVACDRSSSSSRDNRALSSPVMRLARCSRYEIYALSTTRMNYLVR